VVRVQTEGATLDALGRIVPRSGVGTGVIIDEEGHVITNNHVIRIDGSPNGEIARQIIVSLDDQRTYGARVIGTDPPTDLAVLKIEAVDLVPARLGRSGDLLVGDDVVAIGFALDLEGGPTVTRGVVSAKGRSIQEDLFSIPDAIQTDAGINPGNSGGPLVNVFGEVVGINTAIIAGAQNIGFAISFDLARPIVEELLQTGRVERGFLGVNIVDVTPALNAAEDLGVDEGVAIAGVGDGSAADRAGLRPRDVIVRIGDREVRNSGELLRALTVFRAGDRVTVDFVRDGERQQTEAVLDERPQSGAAALTGAPEGTPLRPVQHAEFVEAPFDPSTGSG
jgi:S1-C subfamily serine protease